VRILLVNGLRYRRALRACGHHVVACGETPGHDVQLPLPQQSIANAAAAAGFEPDLVLVELFGGVFPLFQGMEDCPYPLAAYTVDASLNLFWLRHLAKLFDFVFVDQKDAVPALAEAGVAARWLPLAVDPLEYPTTPQPKAYDLVFVGRLTAQRRKRANLIDKIASRYDIHVVGRPGDPWLREPEMAALFAQARLVINENIFDGVTMRLFQALAAGAMLLTERTENGLADLFVPGVHLDCFTPDTLFATIDRYLRQPELRESMAAAGQAEVLARHTATVRMQELCDAIQRDEARQTRPEKPVRLLALAQACSALGQRHSAAVAHYTARAEAYALQALDAAPKANDDLCGQAHLTLGLLYARAELDADAAPRLAQAARLLPAHYEPQFALAHLYRRQNNHNATLACLEMVLARLVAVLPASCAAGALANARRLLDEKKLPPRLWVVLGEILAACGHVIEPGFVKSRPEQFPETAAECFEFALRAGGGVHAWRGLAECYAQAGAPDLTYECSLKALELDPASPELAALARVAARQCYAL